MLDLRLAALTVLPLLASIFWYGWTFKNSKNATPPLPPGPKGLPILGYLPFLNPNLHIQFTNLAHKYGPVYKLWLGSKLCVVISSPPLIKEVVRDQDSIFANRDPPVAALVATGGEDIAWSPNGPYWRDMRKLFVREMLSGKHLQESYTLRREEVRKLIRNLYTNIGKAVDIGELIFLTELNVVLRLLWGGTISGEKYDKVGSEFRDKICKLVDLLGKPNVSDFFPGLAKFDVQGIGKEMRDALPGVEEIFDSVIAERMKMKESDVDGSIKDFLGILLNLNEMQQVGERAFRLPQIKAILLDIVTAGTDTTATIVEWVLAELLHNPSVMEKVQHEITNVVGSSNIVEESHIFELHHLEAVVKETFRLHPPVPLLIPRCPSQSCIVGGYTIPKGSRVFLNIWGIQRDPKVWKDPLEFNPERFLNDSSNGDSFDYLGNSFQFLPFGSGRRVCPGFPLAERMAMFLLATLLYSFEWKLPEGQNIDLSEKFGIVMRKSRPLLAVPKPRFPDSNLYA